jgi:23S rRNA (uridine2552-2'-O)-methyltransferase
VRDVQDYFFKLAKEEGYRSRAAYKLLEIDRRKHIMRRGDRVLDAGAAPGSWSQVASTIVGPRGVVVAVDLKAIDPADYPPNVKLMQADLREVTLEQLGGKPFDAIISDMAPDTTGDPSGDHFVSARLCNALLDLAGTWLKVGGNLVMKVYEGADYPTLVRRAERLFDEAKGFKPKASRAESVEMFVICHGYRGPKTPRQTAEDDFLPKRKPSTGWKTNEDAPRG